MTTPPPDSQTRASLIAAGLHLFGHKGYDGTSTRELALRAGTNVASIAYHFGGKAGLRAACGRTVGERVSAALASGAATDDLSPAQAAERIAGMARGMIVLIVAAPEAQDMVAFMLRELTDPGEVADMMYRDVLEPRHRTFCALWARATGRAPEDATVKLAVFAIIGQIFYFRVAQPFVGRRMGWTGIGPDEVGQIADLVLANLHSTLERQRT